MPAGGNARPRAKRPMFSDVRPIFVPAFRLGSPASWYAETYISPMLRNVLALSSFFRAVRAPLRPLAILSPQSIAVLAIACDNPDQSIPSLTFAPELSSMALKPLGSPKRVGLERA